LRGGSNSIKVEVLARFYAVQLQGGVCSWEDIERKILAPYSNCQQFWRFCRSCPQRRGAIFLAAHLLVQAQGLLQKPSAVTGRPTGVLNSGGVYSHSHKPAWGVPAVGLGGARGAAGGSARGGGRVPVMWLLQMWVRGVVDYGRRASLWHLTHILAKHPATEELFVGSDWGLGVVADVDGMVRGRLVGHVCKALLRDPQWQPCLGGVLEGVAEVGAGFCG
jgi:hypothetical protein